MVDVATLFDNFVAANNFKSILQSFQHICTALDVEPTVAPNIYKSLRQINDWKAQKLWKLLDKRFEQAEYKKQTAGERLNVLVIGAGPCGLRMAIECALLGCRTVLVEQRDRFSRNNVLHLWEFVIHDLKALGAKIFYPKFCTGSIEHISIRQLQCILLKVALVFGVQIHEGVSFIDLNVPRQKTDEIVTGFRAFLDPQNHILCDYEFDVLIGADGKRNTVKGFPREEMRGKLAIGITANFVNRKTYAEERVPEISGVAYIFNQAFFKEMSATTGVDLENIVYYKDETHYFVMCAKKQSLLDQGVIIKDFDDVSSLLAPENVDQDMLCRYAASAANFATNGKLPTLEYETNHRGNPDIAMFDFTSLFSSKCSVRLVERKQKYLLVGIVGDSLHEPFWPTGSGCARGFLGVMDTAWLIREYGLNKKGPLEMIAERESIYRLLAQVTKDNLHKQMTKYTIDPRTRYVSLEMTMKPEDVMEIVNSDNPRMVDIKEPMILNNPSSVHNHPDRLKYALWRFCHHALAPYKLKLVNMDSSWFDGRALAALVAKFRPDVVDYFAVIAEEEAEERLQHVFSAVSQQMSIDRPCSPFLWSSLPESNKVAYIGRIVGALRSDSDRVQRALITPRSAASKKKQDRVSRVDASKAKKSEPIQKLSQAICDLYGTPVTSKRRVEEKEVIDAKKENEDSKKICRKRMEDIDSAHKYKTLLEQQQEDEKHFTKRPQVDRLNPDLVYKVQKIVSGDLVEEQTRAFRAEKEKQSNASTRKMDRRDLDKMEEKLENTGMGRSTDKDLLRTMSSREEKIMRAVAADARREAHAGFTKEYEKNKFKDIDTTLQRTDDLIRMRELTGVDVVSKLKETEKQNSKGTPPPPPAKNVSVDRNSAGVIIRPVAPVQPKRQSQSMPTVESLYDSVNPRKQQKCQICDKVVYLAERMQVESMFIHKQCFKCAYCGLPLRLGESGQDRELENHYKNKFFCKTHLRCSLREKIARIQKNERKALEKRNSNDEGSTSDSSKENIDPPLQSIVVSQNANGATVISNLPDTPPVIRVQRRNSHKSTLNFYNPEQLREKTAQRMRETRDAILSSPVGDEIFGSATPERAVFHSQEVRKTSSVCPEAHPIDCPDLSDSDDDEEDVISSPEGSEESHSRDSNGGEDSLSDEEDDILAEEDLQELERTVLEIADENPNNEITDDQAMSVLERINHRRLSTATPSTSKTITSSERTQSTIVPVVQMSSQEQFFTPMSTPIRPVLKKAVSEDTDSYMTPKERQHLQLEQMRSAARERARMKSDEELGLGPHPHSLSSIGERRSVPAESALMEEATTEGGCSIRSNTVSPPRERDGRIILPVLKSRAFSMLDDMPSMRREALDIALQSTETPSVHQLTLEKETPPALPASLPPVIRRPPVVPAVQPQGLLLKLFSPDVVKRRPSPSRTTYPSEQAPPTTSNALPLKATSPQSTPQKEKMSESQKERNILGKANIWNKLKMRRSPPESPSFGHKASTSSDIISVTLNSDVPCAAVAPSPRIPLAGVDNNTKNSESENHASPITVTDRSIKMIQKRAEKIRRQHDEDKRRNAQDIQRGLGETEFRLEQIEEKGRRLEERLKKDPTNRDFLEEWMCLVQEREILRSREDDLRLRAKGMELEETYKVLNARFKEHSTELTDDAQASLLRDMLAIIDRKKKNQKEMEESRERWRRPFRAGKILEEASYDYRNCTPTFIHSSC